MGSCYHEYMALVKCLECGKKISDKAKACPHCGFPLKETFSDKVGEFFTPPSPKTESETPLQLEEYYLYNKHPSMTKSHPVLFILSIFLVAVYGIGSIIICIWWLRNLSITLIITNKKIIKKTGLFSKKINQIYHKDILNIQVFQGILDKVLNVGKIGIATAGTGLVEIELSGLPKPHKVKEIIDNQRKESELQSHGLQPNKQLKIESKNITERFAESLAIIALLLIGGTFYVIQTQTVPSPEARRRQAAELKKASVSKKTRETKKPVNLTMTVGGHFACTSKWSYDDIIKYIAENDAEAVATLVTDGFCVITKPGKEVYFEGAVYGKGFLGIKYVKAIIIRPKGSTTQYWTDSDAITR